MKIIVECFTLYLQSQQIWAGVSSFFWVSACLVIPQPYGQKFHSQLA